MAEFDPTEWFDDAEPDIMAAQLNRMEAGILDAVTHHKMLAALPDPDATNHHWLVFNTTDNKVYVNFDGASWTQLPTGGAQVVTQDEDVPLPQRTALDFRGATVAATDDEAGDRTIITISAPAQRVFQDEDTPLAFRNNVDFRGKGVRAIDDGAGDRTVVIIEGSGAGGTGVHIADLPWINEGDANGLISYLGTNGGQQAFGNPAGTALTVTRSSQHPSGSYLAQFTTDRDPASFFANDSSPALAWIEYDLGADRLVSVSHWSLRTRSDGPYHFPRTFKLRGSNDGAEWTDLDVHVDDPEIDAAGAWFGFTVDTPGAFRYLRLEQTKNHDEDPAASNSFNLAEIEFYGELLSPLPTGHVIVDPADAVMPKRGRVKFAGAVVESVEDDDANDETVVTLSGRTACATFDGNATVRQARGCTVARISAGLYELTFVPAFTTPPSVTVGRGVGAPTGVDVGVAVNATAGSVRVKATDASGAAVDCPLEVTATEAVPYVPPRASLGGSLSGVMVSYGAPGGIPTAMLNKRGAGTANQVFGWPVATRGDFVDRIAAVGADNAYWYQDGAGHDIWIVGYINPGGLWVGLTHAQFENELATIAGLPPWGAVDQVPYWMP